MTYERQRTVKDNELHKSGKFKDDPNEPEATKGVLSHGDADGVIKPIQLSKDGSLVTTDADVLETLDLILSELRKINLYNEITHDTKID